MRSDALSGTATFAGTFTPTHFVNQNGQLAAVGTLTGTLTNSVGTTLGTVTQQVTTPLQASGTCHIRHLNLGPLDLDPLGLQVHLDEVVLDITAQQGPGDLLGNLRGHLAHPERHLSGAGAAVGHAVDLDHDSVDHRTSSADLRQTAIRRGSDALAEVREALGKLDGRLS